MFNFSNERYSYLVVCLLLLFLAGISLRFNVAEVIDHVVLDTCFELNRKWFPQPITNDPVVVGINQDFLDEVDEPLALSHAYLSKFLDVVSEAKPQVIGMDLILPEKRFDTLLSTRNPSLNFHKILLSGLLHATRQTKVIVAKIWNKKNGNFLDIQMDYAAVLGMQGNEEQSVASSLFCPDSDGRIRSYPGKECQPDRTEKTFASEVNAAMGNRKNWSGLINYQLGAKVTPIALQDVLVLADKGDTERLHQLFAGKVVLLGTMLDDEDLLEIPVALDQLSPEKKRISGMLVHVQMLRSMLSNKFIQPVSLPFLLLLCGAFSFFWLGGSVRGKLLLLCVASIALLVVTDSLLLAGYWLPPGTIMLTGIMGFVSRSTFEGWNSFKDKRKLSRIFSGYVSPFVMQKIISGKVEDISQGRKMEVCVMFADIRNFTTLSEHLHAEEVVKLLNRYFPRMTEVIHRHGGTVDKFIGDGIMAFYGSPNILNCPEKCALESAHEMLIELAELNKELVAEGRKPLAIGIGLHSGEAIIGLIGSKERHEYTAIGDTVNITARLEGLCKDLDYPIVCSEKVAAAVYYPSSFVRLGEQPLKGRSPVSVFGWNPQVDVV
jgi:class 3 adenylate cyclase